MKIDYCFHSHTDRCGHARGCDEHYVLEAIDAGIKTLGFSDHVFLPGVEQPGIRGSFKLFDDYVNSVKTLKERYKDKIEIFLGFECEWFDQFENYYKSLIKDKKLDYLILGQHFFMEDDGTITYVRNDLENAEKYMIQIEKAFKSGLFTYFAHPDLVMTLFKEFDKEAEKLTCRICKLAKKYNIPLEINLNGMTWSLPSTLSYPVEDFWRVVGEEGNEVVVGYDAHYPEFYSETKYINKALGWIKKYKLNTIKSNKVIERINFIKNKNN